jgi:phospholipid transport system transporter-binding protein
MPIFSLPAEVTLDSASAVRRHALSALSGSAESWAINASALQTFDSAGLALLLELRRAAPAATLQIVQAPRRLHDLAVAYGIEFVLSGTEPASAAQLTI